MGAAGSGRLTVVTTVGGNGGLDQRRRVRACDNDGSVGGACVA